MHSLSSRFQHGIMINAPFSSGTETYQTRTHTHTHAQHVYAYYMCVCVSLIFRMNEWRSVNLEFAIGVQNSCNWLQSSFSYNNHIHDYNTCDRQWLRAHMASPNRSFRSSAWHRGKQIDHLQEQLKVCEATREEKQHLAEALPSHRAAACE